MKAQVEQTKTTLTILKYGNPLLRIKGENVIDFGQLPELIEQMFITMYKEAGIKMEEIGVAAITLHPRTTNQQFNGQSNWDLIKELKEAVNIPVIGNGDINCLQDYYKMKCATGCDAVMIGRAALGNPWIFQSIVNGKSVDLYSEVDIFERIRTAKRHFIMLEDYYNPRICINLSKKHFNYYFKGFEGASHWRKKFMKIETVSEIKHLLKKMEESLTIEISNSQ